MKCLFLTLTLFRKFCLFHVDIFHKILTLHLKTSNENLNKNILPVIFGSLLVAPILCLSGGVSPLNALCYSHPLWILGVTSLFFCLCSSSQPSFHVFTWCTAVRCTWKRRGWAERGGGHRVSHSHVYLHLKICGILSGVFLPVKNAWADCTREAL